MKRTLAHLMIVQEACQKIKKLQDSCQAYTEVSSMDSNISDLRIKSSNWIPGKDFELTDFMLPSEKIEAILRGPKHQNSLKDGTYAFVEGISEFLNSVQEKRFQIAESNRSKVAQK